MRQSTLSIGKQMPVASISSTLNQLATDFDMDDVIADFISQHPELSNYSDLIVKQYREFMENAKNGLPLSVPNDAVDLLWHVHICHTLSYHRFCDTIAGEYIHHTPKNSKFSTLKIHLSDNVKTGCTANDGISALFANSKGCTANDGISALAA